MVTPEQKAPEDIAASPRWYAHAFDSASDRLLLVERTEEDFRAASFLDARSLSRADTKLIVQWSDAAAAFSSASRRDAQYIFHIGHVGSTLISRLLGEAEGILSLREPLLLRSLFELAEKDLEERISVSTALLSRTFRPEQRVIVKATSFTSELAPLLVQPGSRALLLYTSAENYIANILAGEASRQELQLLSESRLRRLGRRLGELPWELENMGEAQKAALGWACEMCSLADAAEALPDGSTSWRDFDAFLANPAPKLMSIASHFGHDLSESKAEALCSGPLMNRYSKAPEYAYSPRLREQVIAQSRRENGGEIQAAMDWLAEAARLHPAIAVCLELTE